MKHPYDIQRDKSPVEPEIRKGDTNPSGTQIGNQKTPNIKPQFPKDKP